MPSVRLPRRQLLVALAPVAGRAQVPSAPVRMPGPPFPIPESKQFQRALLQLALRKAGWSEELTELPSQTWMRQLRELQAGHADVAPLPALAGATYEPYGLLRVDFPLRRGLLGVRRLMVRESRLAEFSALPDIATLNQRYTLGYGSGWGDLPVMRRLGVRLRTAETTPGLYDLLRAGGVDYLSRGLNELENERPFYEGRQPAIAPVPGLLLAYPLDDCFFVAPQRADLHAALKLGLQRALRDGSYADLFQQHYGPELGPLGGARVLTLEGYPTPEGIAADHLQGWRQALPAHPVARRAAPMRLVMAGGQQAADPRFRYALRLLELALAKASQRVELLSYGGMTQPRQAAELSRGWLDVGLLPAQGTVRPGQALPVRFPIRRGLLGLRLLLARKERAAALAAAPTLAALQRDFRLGHGADWGDLALMRQAGFQVVTSDSYAGLFRMLEAGRFDFLSRAVSEVWDELATPALAGSGLLAVVPSLALFYPLDDFFWVNPARAELAEAIALGLQRARADGSFDALYRATYGEAVRRAQLVQRRLWQLPGILPPADTPIELFDAPELLTQRLASLPAALG